MGTVIDELIVELNLDPKQFDEGAKAAAAKLRLFEREHDRHSKSLSSNTNEISRAFQGMQNRLLGIAALFMGGMGVANFTDHIIKLTAQVGYLATSLGLSTAEITKWQAVGAQRGAAPGEMAASIKSVRDAASDLGSGRQSEMQKFSYMTRNNPGPFVHFDKDTDPTKFMIDVSRWLEYHKKKGPQEYARAQRVAGSMLGFGQGTLNTLDMGPEQLEKQLKAMEKYAPSPEETKKIQKLQEAMAKAAVAAEAAGRALIALLQPGFIKFVDDMKRVMDAFRERGFMAGVREFNAARSAGVAEAYSGATSTVGGWAKGAYNWGKRKLGLSSNEPKPVSTFDERWKGDGGAAPSEVLEKARQVALSGGPAAVETFMAKQGFPKNGAWCGEFAAATVKAAGGTPPKNPQVASNWRNYGNEVTDPRPGDIAVRRGAPTGSTGSHVTIVEELNRGGFVGLGGNQRGGMHSNFSRASYQYYRGQSANPSPPKQSDLERKLIGAGLAMRAAEDRVVNNNKSSSETHVNEIKVTVPPGTDGKGIAREVSRELSGHEPAHADERRD